MFREIQVVGPELRALDFTKSVLFCLVYTLTSINLKLSKLNFVTIYVAIRSRMNSILGLIGPVFLESSALELEKCFFHFVYTHTSSFLHKGPGSVVDSALDC